MASVKRGIMNLQRRNRRLALGMLGGMFAIAALSVVFVLMTSDFRRKQDHEAPVKRAFREYIPDALILGTGAAVVGGLIVWRFGTKSQ